MKLAFDLDNTIWSQGTPENNYKDVTMRPDMVELVNKLFDEGHEIYFYTARHFKHFVWTTEQLKQAGLKYTGLVMNKISVDLFIDDRGFRWEDGKHQELLDLIDTLKPKKY